MTAGGDQGVLFSGTRELDVPYLPGQDPRPLHLAFAELFDRAALAVHQAGSDLDEVLVERTLVARTLHVEREITASFLSDAGRLEGVILSALTDQELGREGEIEVFAVRLIARRDELI